MIDGTKLMRVTTEHLQYYQNFLCVSYLHSGYGDSMSIVPKGLIVEPPGNEENLIWALSETVHKWKAMQLFPV